MTTGSRPRNGKTGFNRTESGTLRHSTRPRAFRITPVDAAILLAVAGAFGYVGYKAATGLNYHWKWEIIPQYILRFDETAKAWVPGLLVHGLLTTIRLSLWSGILATILGTIMGLFRVSPRLFRRQLAGTYVELIRNTPPLVLVFVFYFYIGDQIMALLHMDEAIQCLPPSSLGFVEFLFGPPHQMPQFLSAVITLSLFEGAYIAEIVRAGLESIEPGQWEAARSLGMSRFKQMRYIIMPQAMQRMLPALAGQFISTIKDSAIVSVISIEELTFQGQQLMATTYRSFEVWITVLAMYFALTFCCSLAVRKLELGLQRK